MGSNLGLCQANGSALEDCVENNEKAVRKPMSIEQPPLHHNTLVQPRFSPPIGFISFITRLLFIIFNYGVERKRERRRDGDVSRLVPMSYSSCPMGLEQADLNAFVGLPVCYRVVFILDGLTRLTFMISDDIVRDYGNLSFIVVKLIGCR